MRPSCSPRGDDKPLPSGGEDDAETTFMSSSRTGLYDAAIVLEGYDVFLDAADREDIVLETIRVLDGSGGDVMYSGWSGGLVSQKIKALHIVPLDAARNSPVSELRNYSVASLNRISSVGNIFSSPCSQ